jgi:hypothetical protein
MTDILRIEQMSVLAVLIGGIDVVGSVAHQSFLPSLVRRSDLPAANARLEGSSSAATIVGPSVAGVLVQCSPRPSPSSSMPRRSSSLPS